MPGLGGASGVAFVVSMLCMYWGAELELLSTFRTHAGAPFLWKFSLSSPLLKSYNISLGALSSGDRMTQDRAV